MYLHKLFLNICYLTGAFTSFAALSAFLAMHLHAFLSFLQQAASFLQPFFALSNLPGAHLQSPFLQSFAHAAAF